MKKIRSISRIIAIALLPAVFALYYNAKANEHMHIQNGNLISHSHPYKNNSSKEPIQKHQHNPGILHLMNIIGDNFSDGSASIEVVEIAPTPETAFTHNQFQYKNHFSAIIRHFGLRAPPFNS